MYYDFHCIEYIPLHGNVIMENSNVFYYYLNVILNCEIFLQKN